MTRRVFKRGSTTHRTVRCVECGTAAYVPRLMTGKHRCANCRVVFRLRGPKAD